LGAPVDAHRAGTAADHERLRRIVAVQDRAAADLDDGEAAAERRVVDRVPRVQILEPDAVRLRLELVS
jgi:hypothetical protein